MNGHLFSSSSDRTIKVWNTKTARCLSSIYTHSQIVDLYYNTPSNLLIAIGSKLGENVLLAFSLLYTGGGGPNRVSEELNETTDEEEDNINLNTFFINLTQIS